MPTTDASIALPPQPVRSISHSLCLGLLALTVLSAIACSDDAGSDGGGSGNGDSQGAVDTLDSLATDGGALDTAALDTTPLDSSATDAGLGDEIDANSVDVNAEDTGATDAADADNDAGAADTSIDAGTDDANGDGAGPEDSATEDAALPDAGVIDADTGAVDTEPDVPDTAPDTAPDVPDTAADTAPDTAPDVPDTAPDTAADTGGVDAGAKDAGALTVADQVLTGTFKDVIIKAVALPASVGTFGKLRIVAVNGATPGALLAEQALAKEANLSDLLVTLKTPIAGVVTLRAEVIGAASKPVLGVDGLPLSAEFVVTGDMSEPALIILSQKLAPNALGTINVSFARVPASYTVGLWVAVYSDVAGKPGTLLGKLQVKAGESKDQALVLTSALTKGQVLHAVLRQGAAGTGSWTPSGPLIKDFGGKVVEMQFEVDAEPFHPVLEIEDQTLTDPKKLLIKKVVVPPSHVGGWLAIYADAAGSKGALLAKLYFIKGTKVDQKLSFTAAQQGEQTMHAVLYAGQTFVESADAVMKAPDGSEMTLTFQVSAKSLSYIIAKPYTTKDPRHVMVTRAYSHAKAAWVVLARDEGGKPGIELARKKVLPKFAGNVHFDNLYGDFLENGTISEYLTAKPGTFRRYVRGDEKLHVLLYEDFPADNKFTYTPGGSEDLPVLDATSKPVTGLIDVKVVASVQNLQKDSPRFYFPCPLSQHVSHPTTLPVDCRCHNNIVGLDFPECKADIADALSMTIGEGPRARTHNFGGFRSGFPEAASNELMALMVWKDHKTVWPENKITLDVGAVMAIDMTTRKRRLVAGRYEDPATGIADLGAGPVLSDPFELQKGPDGQYYVASYGYVRIEASLVPTVDVIRVDPKSGNRTYVWRSNHLGFNLDNKPNPYGHCANGRDAKYGYASVQIGRKAFGIDDKGNFYFSYAHNGNSANSDGIGVIKVSADGKTCSFVTRHKVGADNTLYKGKNIGSGFDAQAGPYKGMLVKGGKLYTSTELNDELIEVDLATGDRKMLHKDGLTDTNNGSSGTHVVWDSHRNLIWQAGLSGSTLLFDPAKGTSEPLWCPQNDRDYLGMPCLHPGAWGNNGMPMERGMWLHPTDKAYMFVVNLTMIIRVHLMSGTSEIFSY